jgi:hypothetical protein
MHDRLVLRRRLHLEDVAHTDQVIADHMRTKPTADIVLTTQLELAQTVPLLDPAKNRFDATTGMDRSGMALVAGRATIEAQPAQPNHSPRSYDNPLTDLGGFPSEHVPCSSVPPDRNWIRGPALGNPRGCQLQADGYLAVPQLVRWRATRWRGLDRISQILQAGFVRRVVDQVGGSVDQASSSERKISQQTCGSWPRPRPGSIAACRMSWAMAPPPSRNPAP